MFTVTQLIAHVAGDYLLQSDWMAREKPKAHFPALIHVLVYSIPFLFLNPSFSAWLVIVSTHFAIDRWRLARYVMYAKNFLAPRADWPRRDDSAETGSPKSAPPWLAVWLMIIVDNLIHVVINGLALYYL